MATTVKGTAGLRDLAGRRLGHSGWRTITQEQVNQFAEATGDHQWIHVDVERAKKGPFGGPIAHGYLTLSLGPALMHEVFAVEAVSMGVNYGANKVRFPSPVPVGSQVRAGVEVAGVEDVSGGVQATLVLTFEVRDAPKPACVAEIVLRYYD
jgi:acyl dehydratase